MKETKQTKFIYWDGKQIPLDSFKKLCFPKKETKKKEGKSK